MPSLSFKKLTWQDRTPLCVAKALKNNQMDGQIVRSFSLETFAEERSSREIMSSFHVEI